MRKVHLHSAWNRGGRQATRMYALPWSHALKTPCCNQPSFSHSLPTSVTLRVCAHLNGAAQLAPAIGHPSGPTWIRHTPCACVKEALHVKAQRGGPQALREQRQSGINVVCQCRDRLANRMKSCRDHMCGCMCACVDAKRVWTPGGDSWLPPPSRSAPTCMRHSWLPPLLVGMNSVSTPATLQSGDAAAAMKASASAPLGSAMGPTTR